MGEQLSIPEVDEVVIQHLDLPLAIVALGETVDV